MWVHRRRQAAEKWAGPAPITATCPVQLTLEIGERPASFRSVLRIGAWEDGEGRLCAVAYETDDGPLIMWPEVGSYLASPDGRVRCWMAPGSSLDQALATFERLRPLILQRFGYEALHASAVSVGRAVVALCGTSGTGKSTLGFALDQRGYSQVADDSLVLDVEKACIESIAFPFTRRLRVPSEVRLGTSDTAVSSQAGGMRRSALGAVFVLRRDSGANPLVARRLEPSSAFRKLLMHGHCYSLSDPAFTRRMVEHYLRVAELVPVVDVAFKPGFDVLPDVVSGLERLIADLTLLPARRA